jgi:hypothetical protein
MSSRPHQHIPARQGRDPYSGRNRALSLNMSENAFATRYDKLARNFLAATASSARSLLYQIVSPNPNLLPTADIQRPRIMRPLSSSTSARMATFSSTSGKKRRSRSRSFDAAAAVHLAPEWFGPRRLWPRFRFPRTVSQRFQQILAQRANAAATLTAQPLKLADGGFFSSLLVYFRGLSVYDARGFFADTQNHYFPLRSSRGSSSRGR